MAISLDVLDPGLRDGALALDGAVRESGLQGRFTSTLRTSAEQTRLYRRFLAGASQFPAAPPGASAHEYGLAFDYVVQPYDVQPQLGALWRSWGGGWSQSDAIHFELPGASAAVLEAYNRSQPQSAGAGISSLITKATDFYLGSNVAGLLRLIPGLSKSEALAALSSPYETFQKWLISSISLPSFH